MKIQVTQQDINRGTRQSGYSCPIALALIRLGKQFVTVTINNIAWLNDTEGYCPPAEAISFIKDFDAGRRVYPFEFELL